MAEITFSGLASGLPADLVDKLVAIQKQPLNALAGRKVEVQTRLAAVQDLNAKLLSMKSAMEGLDAAADYQPRSATSSNTTFATVTASSNASAGSYSLSNIVLADNNQLRLTTGVVSKTDPLASGTFAFTYAGGTEKQVVISGGESMVDLAEDINALGTGVAATIINDGSRDHLVLTGADTGAAKTIAVTVNTTLTGFESADFTTVSTAANASFTLDGMPVSGLSNTFTTAIEGVTINLVKATAGETVALSVQADTSAVKTKIKSFVDAYNTVASLLHAHSQYDKDTGRHTVLFADSAVRGIESQMRRIITTPVSGLTGTYTTLAELGITTSTADGTLSINDSKLSTALSSDFNGVGKLFYAATATQGYAKQFVDYLGSVTSTADGVMNGKEVSINKRIDALDRQIERTQQRLSITEARIRAQYASLETLISNMNSSTSGALQSLQNLVNA
ncbi:MAG: flagellar filament capping protein FliD [Nitrospirae bacterium]|nr:flagellar filament capping protein FliD [Nitrospirota bacterium]